jgi:predicted transposase YdaD
MQQSPLYQEWQEEAELRGRQQGQLEERRSLALKMIRANYPLAAIAKLTELSIADLQQLQNKQ